MTDPGAWDIVGFMKDKNKAIINYVIRWLDSNIDEPPAEGVQEDSANLKEKIEYSALENKAINIKTDDEIAYILSKKRLLKNLIKNKLTTVPIVRLPQ